MKGARYDLYSLSLSVSENEHDHEGLSHNPLLFRAVTRLLDIYANFTGANKVK